MKICSVCKHNQPLENFSRPYKEKTALYAQCKKCRAYKAKESRKNKARSWRNMLKRLYGLTPDVVQQMFEKQFERCAICYRNIALNTGNTLTAAHIDHCHKTKKVRGLLCFDCNLGLGRFKDDPASLSIAAEYLRRNQ